MNEDTMTKQRIAGLTPGLRVLITGAATGIGRSIAQAFLEHGARVHIGDRSAEALTTFGKDFPQASTSVVDVGDAQQVENLFDEIHTVLGGLDVLVNNAGISGPTAPLQDIEPQDWDRTVAVDLSGAFYCMRRAVPLLLHSGGGSIVNIASNAALFGYPLQTPYTAAKWGLIGLTKTAAMELGPHNIRVNAICPGSVDGPRIEGVIEREAQARQVDAEVVRQSYLRQNSLRTFIQAEEVANLVLFICSDLGARISGQALGLDGHTETLAQF